MRTVEVELKAKVAQYVAGMRQGASVTKESAQATLALSKAELAFEESIAQATAAVKANGQSLDTHTAKGRANRAALDQIATASRQYRTQLVAQGRSQAEVTAATERGRAAWLASASAMGMGEAQAKRLSGTLFAASRVMQEHRQEVASLSMGLGILGAGMLLATGRAVKGYADFDKTMSGVAATGDDARQSLDRLRATALKAGADTQYSATEAAQGVTNLLKAGVKAEDVLVGGLTGALNLAAAGQMSVADASEVAAITLNQFGLTGRDVAHVADLLVSGANAASGEVSDMAAALNNVGAVAHASGISLEETVGFLTEMAYAGQVGAEAGTQFKSMLLQLQSPSQLQTAALKELNLSLYDGAGKTKKLTQFVDEYRASLEGKTDAEKANYNATIFGSYGIQAATVAYAQAGGSLDQWIKRVNDQGAAQRQASILTDNLTGDVERLGGSLDTVFIQSGSGANNVLRQMAQGAEAVVNQIGLIPGPLLSIATTLTGSGGLAVLGVAGFGKLGSAVGDAYDNMKKLGLSAKTAKLAVLGVGGALAIGTVALSMWADAQAEAKQAADDYASTLVVVGDQVVTTDATLSAFNKRLAETQLSFFGLFPVSVQDAMDRFGVSAQDAQGAFEGEADAVARVKQAIIDYGNSAEGSRDQLAGLYSGQLIGYLDKQVTALERSKRETQQKADADRDAGIGAHSYTEAVTKSTAATKTNTDATADNTKVLDDWIKQQWAAADAALALSGSQVGFERMLDDTAAATEKLVKATKKKTDLTNVDTKAGQDAQDLLDKIATGTHTRVKEMEKEKVSISKITEEQERGRKALVSQARQMGFSESAIAGLVAKYDLLPENVTTTVGEDGASEAETRVNNLLNGIKKLPKSQQAKILSEFNNKGIKAAEAALNKIDHKVAKPKIAPQLTTDTLYVKVVRGKSGKGGGGRSDLDKDNADGNMLEWVRRFDSGGFGQPQVRPFQGAAGVRWGEQGSGPWEAFISGAPQKKDRSLAIWREVGTRLGAFTTAANGAIGAWGAFAVPGKPKETRTFADGAVGVSSTRRGTDVAGYMTSGAVVNNYQDNTSSHVVREAPSMPVTIVGPDPGEVVARAMAAWDHKTRTWAVQAK